jgi:hypothetical protein
MKTYIQRVSFGATLILVSVLLSGCFFHGGGIH